MRNFSPTGIFSKLKGSENSANDGITAIEH